MSKWCVNEVGLYGHEDELNKLIDICNVRAPIYVDDKDALYSNEELLKRESGFHFHGVVPVPRIVLETSHRKLEHPETSWHHDNWGTQFSPDDIYCELADDRGDPEDGALILMFNTSWTPALQWIKRVAEKFPSLNIEYRYIHSRSQTAGEFEYELGKEASSGTYKQGSKRYEELEYELLHLWDHEE